ncbi:MAG: hypothetical protein ACRDLM_11200 [Gaiellaceae bacterium]
MTLLVPWIAFPIVAALASLGFGLLIESAAGTRLHGALLLPIGFAGVIVATDFLTLSGTTARAMVPVVVVLAVLGYVIAAYDSESRARLRALRPDRWLSVAAVAVYAVYAAPVVMLGRATFAGYASLDDTAQWFALIDRVMSSGRNVAGLPPSTYQHVVNQYLISGYPVGSMMPLGAFARLVGRDVAWVLQPYFAFQAVLLALSLWVLLAGPIRSPRWRAAAVFIAAQPALLYGYALWGSIKEVVTAALLPLLAVLVARALRSVPTPRALIPLALVMAAMLATLNVGAIAWLLPALLPLLALARRLSLPAFGARAALLGCLIAVMALPTVVTAHAFAAGASGNITSSATGQNALGELAHPLSGLQLLGIWPVGDFRDRPSPIWPAYLLVAVVLVAALGGLWGAIRRRAWTVPLYVAIAVVGWLVVQVEGSPWTVGKALAEGSPAALAAACSGLGLLRRRSGWLLAAAVAGAVAVCGGVLWSNALAYGGARLAPQDQLADLQQIGAQFSGQGPSMMTEFQPYGVRHFLRGLAVEQLPQRNLDAFPLREVERFRTLVLNHSPSESRPPSNYRLAWSGRFYDVWQRDASAPKVLAHVGLGSGIQPTATPSCSEVTRLATVARQKGAQLAAVLREPPLGFELGAVRHPENWLPDPTGGLYPTSAGDVEAVLNVATSGTYRVWMGGYTPGSLTITIDGHAVGSLDHRIELPGQFFPLDTVQLTAGQHAVVLHYTRPLLQPGSTSGVALLPIGPVIVSKDTEDLPVERVPPSRARSLCGKSLDWLEVVAR